MQLQFTQVVMVTTDTIYVGFLLGPLGTLPAVKEENTSHLAK